MMRYLALLLCLMVLAVPACAQDRFTISVPGVIADGYQHGSYMTADFDFGQSFSSIDMLEFHVVGLVHPGMGEVNWGWSQMLSLGGWFDVEITDTDGTPGPGSASTSLTDVYNTYVDEWHMPCGMFDALLDGKGSVRVGFFSEEMGSIFQYAWGDLYDFEIAVTGTPVVPEPSSLLCLAGGLSGLLLYRRRK